MFPVVIESGGDREQGMVTLGWWEEYKEFFSQHKDYTKAKIKMHRLIACPPRTPEGETLTIATLSAYQVYADSKALKIDEARRIVDESPGISLLQIIKQVLNADDGAIPSGALVHLIGAHNGTGGKVPSGWKQMVQHFQDEFHTVSRDHNLTTAPDVGGVYYKYLAAVPQELRPYDDVFLIHFPEEDQAFGIVLSVDEVLDTSGIRILKPSELPNLLQAFQTAWAGGSSGLCFSGEQPIGA
jgi:hypothetical protein